MPEDRAGLDKLVRWRKTAQDFALRARVVLRCAEGATNRAVAREARACAHTVGKWRGRFARDRLEGLQDQPRSGAPRTVTDEQVTALLTRTLEVARDRPATPRRRGAVSVVSVTLPRQRDARGAARRSG